MPPSFVVIVLISSIVVGLQNINGPRKKYDLPGSEAVYKTIAVDANANP